jgi:type 1 glutamine amidotransferase
MGGRSFYTALGHTGASYQDELFVRSIALGVEWAGGMGPP